MDSFFGIGPFELVFILIIALIVLGPERLPQALRQTAAFVRQVRSLATAVTAQVNAELGDLADLDPRDQIRQALTDEPAPRRTPAARETAATEEETA